MHKITFTPFGKSSSVTAGTTILAAARLAGVEITAPCGGEGACGKCRVRIVSGSVDFKPNGKLDNDLVQKGFVLACRARCAGDPVVDVPAGRESSVGRIEDSFDDERLKDQGLLPGEDDFAPMARMYPLTVPAAGDSGTQPDFDRFATAVKKHAGSETVSCPVEILQRLTDEIHRDGGALQTVVSQDGETSSIVDVFSGTDPDSCFGVAVDVGTTTVAVALVRFPEARIVALHSDYNGQVACGLDVISRINYARRDNGRKELQERVLATINGCISRAVGETGIQPRQIVCASISGNTTMTHLVLGCNPEYIRIAPFIPSALEIPLYNARDIGIGINPYAPVQFSPGVGSYVGGDITAGVLCTPFAAGEKEPYLFMDIGTNGELVLGNDEFLLACACSAGPAFEGGGIGIGMRASDGAVERVAIDRESGAAQVFTIGNTASRGICGSGMISLVAGLFRTGWLDRSGKLDRDRRSDRVIIDSRRAKYVLVPASQSATGEDLVVAETDFDNIIRAKAAVYSACALMLKQAGMGFSDLHAIGIAGGFGRYLNVDDAITIGLLPDIDREKFVFIGNASLAGSYMTLISEKHRRLQKDLSGKMTYIELTTDPAYMEQYTAALLLPHTDMGLFPGAER